MSLLLSRRSFLIAGNHIIEIDVYTDRDLIVAEVEVGKVEELKEILAIGRDISDDPGYKNRNLAK